LKLNQTNINSKTDPPATGQKIYWDNELKGFGLRVTANGSKTYVVEKRINGKTTRRTVGKANLLSNHQARIDSMKLLLEMEQGKDPKAVATEKKLQAITVSEVFEEYKRTRELRPRTIGNYDYTLTKCLPDWLDKPITDLTRDMVEKRLMLVANANGARGQGKAMAGECYKLLRILVRFAQEQYEIAGKLLLDNDPTRNLSRQRSWTEKVRRQTVVQRHQLADWFKAVMKLGETTAGITARDYLIFTILTGFRRNEGLGLMWSEVDLTGKSLKLPSSRTKNGQEHWLPLPDYLCDLLRERRRINQLSSQYVFPGRKPGTRLQEPKRVLKKVTESSGVTFMIHDLRRTFITIAESLDIPAFTLKKLVNHSIRNDVTGGYIVTDMERLREPVQRITDYILEQAGITKDELTKAAL